ncbi:MAG: hypothetical protein GY804_08170 [Alphaproteobacteria bacterium]|nr:hypothetical protein [Alphaproteobacteria bacterium]
MFSFSYIFVLFFTIAVITATSLMLLSNFTKKNISILQSGAGKTLQKNQGYLALIVIAIGWSFLSFIVPDNFANPQTIIGVFACAIGISLLPFIKMPSPEIMKQTSYFVASTIIVLLLPDAPIFQGYLPSAADKLASILSLVWFLNIYVQIGRVENLDITETLFICLGLLITPFHTNLLNNTFGLHAAVISASAAGFYIFNTYNKQIGFGETANAAIGLLIGWLLLFSASQGLWALAIILPMYYFTDTTAAIILKISEYLQDFKNNKYSENLDFICEKAISKGVSPSLITKHIAKQNIILIIFGLASVFSNKQAPILFIAGLICFMTIKAMLHADDPEYGKKKSIKELLKETKNDMQNYIEETKDVLKQNKEHNDHNKKD